LESDLATKDVEIVARQTENDEIQETIYTLDGRLQDARDNEAVDKVVEKLTEAAAQLTDGYKQIDKMWTQRGQLDQEIGGLDEENWIAELKLESDAIK
jgi:hypothetical protein